MSSSLSEAELERLKTASVLVVGVGALGVPVASHLAAAGTGRIGVVDSGRDKTEAAAGRLGALNPDVQLDPYPAELDERNSEAIVDGFGLVVDCSGNPATRELVNHACVKLETPLVEAGVDGLSGWITVIRPGESACYGCIPADLKTESSTRGAESLGPLAGVIGSLGAIEAIKLLTGTGEPLLDRVLRIDAWSASVEEFRVARRADCAACREAISALDQVS